MRPVRPLILAVAVALTACDDPSGPDSMYLGYIATEEMLPEINVMQTDSALYIEVHTFGLNSCHIQATTDVDVDADARTITVRPFDRIDGDDCRDIVVTITHQAWVQIDESGTWVVRVKGIRYDGADNDPHTVEVEYAANLDAIDS